MSPIVQEGRLEVICGPMFAGKTTELIRRIELARSMGLSVSVQRPARDTRSLHDAIETHGGARHQAVEVLHAGLVRVNAKAAPVVVIDEAHFFGESLLAPCLELVRDGRRVIVAGIDVEKDKGTWYRELGQGMGPTLNTAAAMNAYVLADRGTWLSFKNRAGLVIVVEGDQRLFNQYGIMLVNPAKHAHVKKELGMAFVDWVTSPEGQKAIAAYKIGGEQLFFPNAGQAGA